MAPAANNRVRGVRPGLHTAPAPSDETKEKKAEGARRRLGCGRFCTHSPSLGPAADYSLIAWSLSRLTISIQRAFFRRTIPFSRSLDMLRDTVSTVIPR